MLIKIIALGLIGSFLSLILKRHNKELLPFFELAVVISAAFLLKDFLSGQGSALRELFNAYSQGQELFNSLFKGAVITVLTKLASEVCRESGNSLMGDIIELGGRVMLIALSLPFITETAQVALSFVK